MSNCIAKSIRVNQDLVRAQATGDFLYNYEKIDEKSSAAPLSMSFLLRVKNNCSLFQEYNITAVSVCVPMDVKIIEILLFDMNNSANYDHPLIPDVERFDSVEDLISFLDELATWLPRMPDGWNCVSAWIPPKEDLDEEGRPGYDEADVVQEETNGKTVE
tara:strand:+ start:59 stop:538 length:480 start_codon:yes stop_codon:yes gene_type:complete